MAESVALPPISQQSLITLSKTAELLVDPNRMLKEVYEGTLVHQPNRHKFRESF